MKLDKRDMPERVITESNETDGEDTQSSKGKISRNSVNISQKWDSYHIGATKYEKAIDRGDHARALFEDILEFKQVDVCLNYTKDEIIDKMESLQQLVNNFE